MVIIDEDAAALTEADDHLATHILPMGWEVTDIGETRSVVRGRPARQAIVRRGEVELAIVWDRGLQAFLTATDIDGTRFGVFDPALCLAAPENEAVQILEAS